MITEWLKAHSTFSYTRTQGRRVRYSHEHPLAFITLTQSNVSYNLYFSLQLPPEAPEKLRGILEAVGNRWVSHKIDFYDVMEDVKKMLKSEA